MRAPWLLALLALAACDRAAPPADNQTAPIAVNQVDPTPAPAAPLDPPPATNQAAPAMGSAIPEAFHGVFDTDVAACAAASSIYRLTVSAAELRFHESLATVRMVTSEGADAIRVAADYSGEGMEWSNTQRLALAERGARLTIIGEGPPTVRRRCPA